MRYVHIMAFFRHIHEMCGSDQHFWTFLHFPVLGGPETFKLDDKHSGIERLPANVTQLVRTRGRGRRDEVERPAQGRDTSVNSSSADSASSCLKFLGQRNPRENRRSAGPVVQR
jgi:hypothetical protein